MIRPGEILPDFNTSACVSIDAGKEFQTVSKKDLSGQWAVLYSYPKDFTFVCPTEIVALDEAQAELKKRNAVLMGGSTDNEYSHLAWRQAHPQLKSINHPLLFLSPRMVEDLGILHPAEGVALRTTLIIDPDGIVRYVGCNDLSVGRDVAEIVRILDALQTDQLTPCNWKPGEETLG